MIQPSQHFWWHDFLKTRQNQSAEPMSSWTLMTTDSLFCSLYWLFFYELQLELPLNKSLMLECFMLYPSENNKTCLTVAMYKQLDFHMLRSFISTGFCTSIFSAPPCVWGYKAKILHHSLVTQETDKDIQSIPAQPKPTTYIYLNI